MTNERKITESKEEAAIQGEGDYAAARRYRKDAEEFAQSTDLNKAGHDAAPGSQSEAREMEQAEAIGKSHAVGGKSAGGRG